MTVIPPCVSCARFYGKIREVNVCDAFPGGIPREIIFDGDPHTEPFPGDHGLQFEEGKPHSEGAPEGFDLVAAKAVLANSGTSEAQG